MSAKWISKNYLLHHSIQQQHGTGFGSEGAEEEEEELTLETDTFNLGG